MKKYNVNNYIRYKNDLEKSIEIHKDDLRVQYLPLVETIARRFSTDQKYIGILDINDLIQEGSIGLCLAIRNIEQDILDEAEDPEATLVSFLSKRIKGTIRRAINNYRNNMRIPESEMYKLKKQKDEGGLEEEEKYITQFLQAIFLQLDNMNENGISYMEQIANPESEPILNDELEVMIKKFLNEKEQVVIKRSYGIGVDRMKAKRIALEIGLKGENSQVRVSEIKRAAIIKLYNNLDKNKFLKFL